MIVRWDRPHRHVKIIGIWTSRVPHGSWTLDVFLRSIMHIRLREYLVFGGISFHDVILHCIPWHTSFFMIMYFIGDWKVFDIWLWLFDELDLVFCWYCECLFVEGVIDKYWAFCWEYVIVRTLLLRYVLVNGELLGWNGFMQVVLWRLGWGVRSTRIYPFSFGLEVYLLSIVWFVTHPCFYNFL